MAMKETTTRKRVWSNCNTGGGKGQPKLYFSMAARARVSRCTFRGLGAAAPTSGHPGRPKRRQPLPALGHLLLTRLRSGAARPARVCSAKLSSQPEQHAPAFVDHLARTVIALLHPTHKPCVDPFYDHDLNSVVAHCSAVRLRRCQSGNSRSAPGPTVRRPGRSARRRQRSPGRLSTGIHPPSRP